MSDILTVTDDEGTTYYLNEDICFSIISLLKRLDSDLGEDLEEDDLFITESTYQSLKEILEELSEST